MISRIGAVLRQRQVLMLLVRRDLKVKYADSYLGYFWTILDPLLMSMVYFFVFSVLGRGRLGAKPYIVFLLIGLLPWNWFTGVVSGATRAITSDSKLVRSTRLPREVWALRLVGSKFAGMVLSLPVLAGFAIGLQVWPSSYVFALPIALVLQAVLLAGLALLVSSVTVLVGDLEKLVRILLRIAFYLSPIIYSVSNVYDTEAIPEWVKAVYSCNPMVGIINLYQAVLFPQEFVGWWLVGISSIGSLVMFVVGWATFARLESAVLKEL